MNIRKNIDYSAMYAAMDTAIATGMSQMELYCQLGALVCDRPEKGAAVAAAEYLKNRYQDASGFSPRNLRRMRDFYRMYGGKPELLKLAMEVSWTHNVVILEAELNLEERRWYLRAAQQFGWSKADLKKKIAAEAHLELLLDESEVPCYDSFFGPASAVSACPLPADGKDQLEAPSKFCKENDFLAPCHLFSLRHVLYNNK